MRFYKVEVNVDGDYLTKWFSSRREGVSWAEREYASHKEWYETREGKFSEYPQKLLKEINIHPYDIGTNKQSLLHFLNLNCTDDS
tara:strand:- start:462 stop:716 length:255 start_codon:yes stop_codon:yes gene_type:complete